MNRTKQVFSITDVPTIKEQVLHWINQFSVCSFLDNHQYQSAYNAVECIAAAGMLESISGEQSALQIDQFYESQSDWLFGHFGYEYHAHVALPSQASNKIGFSKAFFYRPDHLLSITRDELIIESASLSPATIFEAICQQPQIKQPLKPVQTNASLSKEQYIQIVNQLLAHIQKGDCYEINFCQAFNAEHIALDPIATYLALTTISPTPFACYYKEQAAHLICASPERWLKKQGQTILSQPIKGTVKRAISDLEKDQLLKNELYLSPKDRSENVMVVDLVRNDFSRVCKAGSVKVEELYGIYSFPQVHQMISTISGELEAGIGLKELVETGFPMGSMTGAPKKKVMELIAQYEPIERGIFSGAVGYIDPQKNFDFNVVIRSIMYNSNEQLLNYLVGSGITTYSDPEKEYEECLLKAKAIEAALGN